MSKQTKCIICVFLTVEMIIFFIIACSGESSSTGPSGDNQIEPLITETIGTEGGTVETDGFLLTVPQGAFDGSHEISVYSDTTAISSDPNSVTNQYQIKGLPDIYSKGLRLALAYNGTLEDDSYIAYGFQTEDVVTGDTTLFSSLLSVQDSSGYLVCMLEPKTEQTTAGKNSINTIYNIHENWDPYAFIYTKGLTKYRELESSNFLLAYPGYLHDRMGELINMLESHRIKIVDDLGFDLNEIGWKFPIHVMVGCPPGEDEWAVTLTGNRNEGLKLNINESMLDLVSDFPEIAKEAGEHMLGRVLYDYGAIRTPDYAWLLVATIGWAEEIFTVLDNYEKPSNFNSDVWMAPFNGMKAGTADLIKPSILHGKGMSSVIKYLMDDERFGASGLVGTFEDIREGESSVYALMNNVQALAADWWPDFFAKYISGNIYNVPASVFTDPDNIAGTWQIDDETKITHTFTSDDVDLYPDLSAKLFRIDVSYTGLDDDINLSLQAMGELNSDGLAVLVFSINNSSLTLLNAPGSYSSGYEIQNLKDKVDSGMNQFLICVVNSQLYPPYLNFYDIDLTCTLTEQPQSPGYIECGMQIDAATHYFNWTPDNSYDSYADESTISTWASYQGSMTGNTFSASMASSVGTVTITGDMTLTFSSDFKTITHLEWNESHSSSTFTQSSSLVAEDIPFNYGYYGTDIFQIEGEDVCDHVISLSNSQSAPDGLSYNLVDYSCNWSSQIFIALDYIDDGLKQQAR